MSFRELPDLKKARFLGYLYIKPQKFKIMKKLPIYLFVTLFAFVTSCSKKSSGPSKSELLVSASWKFNSTGLDVNKDGFVDTDLPAGYLNNCDLDNILTFAADGTGTVDEGALKCDPGNPQTTPFTWTFNASQTVINFPSAVFNGITGDVTIQKLTATELILQKEVNIGAPTTVNVIINMKH